MSNNIQMDIAARARIHSSQTLTTIKADITKALDGCASLQDAHYSELIRFVELKLKELNEHK